MAPPIKISTNMTSPIDFSSNPFTDLRVGRWLDGSEVTTSTELLHIWGGFDREASLHEYPILSHLTHQIGDTHFEIGEEAKRTISKFVSSRYIENEKVANFLRKTMLRDIVELAEKDEEFFRRSAILIGRLPEEELLGWKWETFHLKQFCSGESLDFKCPEGNDLKVIDISWPMSPPSIRFGKGDFLALEELPDCTVLDILASGFLSTNSDDENPGLIKKLMNEVTIIELVKCFILLKIKVLERRLISYAFDFESAKQQHEVVNSSVFSFACAGSVFCEAKKGSSRIYRVKISEEDHFTIVQVKLQCVDHSNGVAFIGLEVFGEVSLTQPKMVEVLYNTGKRQTETGDVTVRFSTEEINKVQDDVWEAVLLKFCECYDQMDAARDYSIANHQTLIPLMALAGFRELPYMDEIVQTCWSKSVESIARHRVSCPMIGKQEDLDRTERV